MRPARLSALLVTALCVQMSAYPLAASAQTFPAEDTVPWTNDADEAPRPRLNAKLLNPQAIQSTDHLNVDARDEANLEPQAAALPDEPSPIENMYSERVVDTLEQYGYDLFIKNRDSSSTSRDRTVPAGATQDDFVLSIGDELNLTLRGQKQLKTTATIDSEGLLIVDEFDPIPAAGRTLGQVREELESAAAQLYNTEVFLSLNAVNQVDVVIAGAVNEPGRKTLTAFDTVLDALMAAGGIDKSGTLRQIRLIRDGRTINIDLYGLLVYGSDGVDLSLRNGDKIIVRPIGPTVAIAGGVKRPGIYEILPALHGNWSEPEKKSQKLSLNDLLDFSGGVLSTAQNRFLRLDINATGQEQVQDIADPMARVFADGDILMVERGKERRSGTVELTGHVHAAGIHALDDTPSLASLLAKEQSFERDIYPLVGVIERWNKTRLARELIAFPPNLVMAGDYDRTLSDGDVVHLFSHAQISRLNTASPTSPPEQGSNDNQISDESLEDDLIREFLEERAVYVRGAVRRPGAYPVSAGADLESILSIAGGPSLEANTSRIEITRAQPTISNPPQQLTGDTPAEPQPTQPPASRRLTVDLNRDGSRDLALSAGDTVRLSQKYRKVEDNHVLLVGEVLNPGTYDIMPGDTLGSLLERAGGLTQLAYPDGAIFSRTSERKREEGRFKSQARDLELRLAAMLEETDPDKKPSEREISAAKDLIAQLRQAEALGRITVEADPLDLARKPEQDILLESGDRIYIPKRPSTVRVAGEVLSPAALQFRDNQGGHAYITQAGGLTYNADKSHAFVVYPDGSARPLNASWSSSGSIPAGSTIVVPRDPKPFDFMDTAKDLTQILANLATTAIFADAIAISE